MNEHTSQCTGTRREFLWEAGAGFAGLALASLLDGDGFFARHGFAAEAKTGDYVSPLAPKAAHFEPRAKSVIFLFMYGGPPSMDTWDYKPELQQRDGEEVNIEIRRRSNFEIETGWGIAQSAYQNVCLGQGSTSETDHVQVPPNDVVVEPSI